MVSVYFDDVLVGQYFADLLINDAVIVELKAAEAISDEHEAQLLNYLKATDIDVGLLLNFGPKPQVMRKGFDIARRRQAIDPGELTQSNIWNADELKNDLRKSAP